MASGGVKRPNSVDASNYEFNWDDKHTKKTWEAFSKYGNQAATEMTGKNFDKWLKDAEVLNTKTITSTMTGIAFSKVAGPKRKTLNYHETKEVLCRVAEDRASKSKKEPQDELDKLCEKLAQVELPAVRSAAKADTSAGVYNRLTDVKKYTGSHKERFDTETGKGKGKSGRDDEANNSGYVGAYKNKGTYDKAHGGKSP